MIYIDTHAHLNYDNKYGDREQLIADICAAGIERVINVGWNYESSRSAALLAQKHERLYFAAGFHPSNLSDFCAGDHERIAALLSSPKGVAVGEIGLDYHYDGADEAAQKRAFAEQLELADALGLPFAVHSRDAAQDTLNILKDNKGKLSHGGVMHCFSGSPETAKEYLKLGLYISFAGPVTFKNARRLDEVAKIVPADRLLAETDSPYLAPEPVRGTLNTPLNVVRVYEKLAALRGEDAEELALQIRKNAYTLFPKLKN
ncbi:MAG TPA: TatD family hydrolase [Candidatus Borkfalkia excrementavium]|uniref:TatD family hydrolase n=1 Tax=Candidatus Borkfalkia excrementavium TaxID=2838505 RepID=A0A9D1Z7B1_9FIRM|nr:TatD family hydrolase [Candidatus Borkfalkia excrementavium]